MYAYDADVGQGLTFSLVDGPPNLFVVDGCSGIIKVNNPVLNYEANSTYTLLVRVQDDGTDVPGPPRLTADQYVTVIVRDVNEACVTNNYARSIDENSPVGTLIGTPVVATDPDFLAVNATWRTLRFALDTNPRNLFSVNMISGQLAVARNALNYEDPEGNTVEAIIRVYDLGVPSLSCVSRISVQINDVVSPSRLLLCAFGLAALYVHVHLAGLFFHLAIMSASQSACRMSRPWSRQASREALARPQPSRTTLCLRTHFWGDHWRQWTRTTARRRC